MKRFLKWTVITLMTAVFLFLATVAWLGSDYVYAVYVLPLYYGEEDLHVVSTAAAETRVPRPLEPEEPILIDVHGSPVPAARFLRRCLHVQNPEFRLFTRDGSGEIELYVISHERSGKTEVHKAVFIGILHQHDRAKLVALE